MREVKIEALPASGIRTIQCRASWCHFCWHPRASIARVRKVRFRLLVDEFVPGLRNLPIQLRDKACSDEFCQCHRKVLASVANSRPTSQREHTGRPLVIPGSTLNDGHSFPLLCFLATYYLIENIHC